MMRSSPAERLAVLYRKQWAESSSRVPDVFSFLDEHAEASLSDRFEVLRIDQRERSRLGLVLPVENYLSRCPDVAGSDAHKLGLVLQEFESRLSRGEEVTIDGFVSRFPELSSRLWARLTSEPSGSSPGVDTESWSSVGERNWRDSIPTSEWCYAIGGMVSSGPCPEFIDRYRIERKLGEGAFGTVYLAYDDELHRLVAVKVAHDHLATTPEDFEGYLREARTLAQLDHPGVVPVHDVGRTEDGCPFIVEKFIEGSDLATTIARARLNALDAADLVATVAAALQYIHTRGVVHRDIKPANIVIDPAGRPHVTDFGLALRHEDFGKRERLGGTVVYMSPEQARREGHLVDGRSDIFSLGVVFYELLTGSRPFDGKSSKEVLERITMLEPCPPRQKNDGIPRELERICLKALAKRPTDRYNTALDMAEDLREFLAQREAARRGATDRGDIASSVVDRRQEREAPSEVTGIVPKGLRSFDEEDADFFLHLLPGPRDRNGIPESVRFWKSRIEETDAARTFRVGLLYGPSGCGKSSLVKAGLLPRLEEEVVSIFVEATPGDTESRLLSALRRRLPNASASLDLVETFHSLRGGKGVPEGGKVLIALDQFEQWLHGRESFESAELVRALRQCDGGRLQCLLTVRVDFWMVVTRLMRELDIRLIEGYNCAAVDLFDRRHAERVLMAFGQAFARLPETPQQLTKEHLDFLSKAVSELTSDGKVIPVCLALFAEMIKDREWRPTTLRQMGGTQGVAVRFLEESFGPVGPPQRRAHEKAARSVLGALLPEQGTDMKGHSRTRSRLFQASGYEKDSGSFDELMAILDGEMRLLTPTDCNGGGEEETPESGGAKCYQLTHDYVVPPLREWLTSKQRETRHGRAEIMLSERSSLWHVRQEARQLPSLPEWLRILALTRNRKWTPPERAMMRAARRFHVTQSLWLLGVLALVLVGVWAMEYRLDQTIRSDTEVARQAWREGREDEAIAALREARQRGPGHQAVLELLWGEMLTEGSATFHLEPEDLEIEIEPDRAAQKELGLKGEPEVLSERRRFHSGERIRLTVGSYRVRVFRPGKPPLDLPLFIGHVAHDLVGGKRSLPHSFIPKERRNDPTVFTAEQITVDMVIPQDIPEGFIYVNPGPMWRGPNPTTSTRSRKEEKTALDGSPVEVRIHDGSTEPLERDTLDLGLLMAQAETTIGEFRRWWTELGAAYCAWRIEIDSRLPEAKKDTAEVPLAIHREGWRNEKKGIDVDRLEDGEAILDAALGDLHGSWAESWNRYRKEIDARLEQAPAAKDEQPIAIGRETAIAYARTHAPIDPPAFRRWVQRMALEATDYASKLEELRKTLAARRGKCVDPAELPAAPMVRELGRPSWADPHELALPVLEAYVRWLKIWTYYGCQTPIEHILELKGVDRARALKPSTWLWTILPDADAIRNPNGEARALVDSYASDLSEGKAKPLRSHLLQWLERMIAVEEREKRAYELWLSRIEDPESPAAQVLSQLPFAIRYRYGTHLGWDIPTWKEWEKAYRGADARAYVCGDAESRLDAWIDRPVEQEPLTAQGARGAPVSDRSPYGILHMAGNMSEWVRMPEASDPRILLLKGGNFLMQAAVASGSCALRLKELKSRLNGPAGGVATRWTGFRVVRRLGPPAGER